MVDKNVWIKGARLLLSVFIFYEIYIKEAFGNNALILYGTVIIATFFVVVDIVTNSGKLPFMGFPFALLFYGLYSFITGVFISRDISWFYSIMVTYFAFAIVCFDCCYIIKRNGSSEWLLNTFLLSACACAIQTIFWSADYRTEVIVRTMSDHNNPNVLGLAMNIGIFSLIARKKYVINRFWTCMAIAIVFLYVILLTASRKCLFAALFMIFVWMIVVFRTEKHFSFRKISIIVGIITAVCIGVFYYITVYQTTSSFARMMLLNSGVSDRTELYMNAIEYWKTSPIIGIGFGQYQIWSPIKAYSHSSYAEVLCCTGIIGAIIFFIPLIYFFLRIVKTTISKDTDNRYDYIMCLTMAIVEILLGIGQIYLYDVSHLIVLTYLSISVNCILIESQRDRMIQERYGENIIQRRFFKRKIARKKI